MPGNSENQAFDLFISYSRRDSDYVSQIVTHFHGLDLRIWFDRKSILHGQRLRQSILEGIRSSSIILVFVSQSSIASSWVLNELDSAMMREMNEGTALVIPIILGRIADKDIPGDLRGKYYLDLRFNFRKRWLEERDAFTANIIALARGEAFEADKVVLELGDAFIRYISSYKFRNESQATRFDNRQLAQIGREFGIAIAENAWIENGDDSNSEPRIIQNIQIDESYANRRAVERFLNYPEAAQPFVQRYGEFILQQLVLFFVDRAALNLHHFTTEEFGKVFSEIEMLLMFFSICFEFEAGDIDSSYQILVSIDSKEVRYRLVGNSKALMAQLDKMDENDDRPLRMFFSTLAESE